MDKIKYILWKCSPMASGRKTLSVSNWTLYKECILNQSLHPRKVKTPVNSELETVTNQARSINHGVKKPLG